jgi:GNAT superfamily N-acetyltransferase
MATFLHTRRFLSYHGDRFQDVSAMASDKNGRLVAVFPAAVDPTDAARVVSHPGITYGGLVHGGDLRGEKAVRALRTLCGFYGEMGFHRLRYKAVPQIYHRIPFDDDLYALFRLGGSRYRCDLSCAIDLSHRSRTADRRRRGLQKAAKNGLEIAEGAHFATALWDVLTRNLVEKYGKPPTHSLDEIIRLHGLFPKEIEFVVGLLGPRLVAGVVLFSTPQVVHTQYMASSPEGQNTGALDALLEHSIQKARSRGARYFDFGISNEKEGTILNEGLYQFKSEFGAGGVAHEFYELNLRSQEPHGN